jgi:hypothetical protein
MIMSAAFTPALDRNTEGRRLPFDALSRSGGGVRGSGVPSIQDRV